MTKERLEQYRSNKEEIKEPEYKIQHLGDGDSMIGNDVVMDYRSGYGRPQSVVGFDYKLLEARKKRYEVLKSKLEIECKWIEEFIDSINDSILRRMFRLYYIDGLTQKNVAKKVYIERSRVSRKIDDYLHKAHKAQKAHV